MIPKRIDRDGFFLLSVGDSPTLKKSSLKEIGMKREELEAMGLAKEQIDKVLDKYHEEYDLVKKDLEAAQKDLENEKGKISTQADTIKGLKKDLDEFKDADVAGMRKKIEDLETDMQAKDAAHQKEIADRDFNDLLKEGIAASKGRNARAITALLDVETLKASKNQKEDIAAALKALTEAEDSKMLFGEADPKPVGAGRFIGEVRKDNTPQGDTLRDAIAEHYNRQ